MPKAGWSKPKPGVALALQNQTPRLAFSLLASKVELESKFSEKGMGMDPYTISEDIELITLSLACIQNK